MLAECGVERTVLVQPEPSLDATRAALELAGGVPWVAGASVWADVAAPDAGAVLDELGAHPKLRGLCLAVDGMEGNHWLTEESVVRGLREAAARGLSLDVIASPAQLPAVGALAAALPELRIVVDHLGGPPIGRGEREPWGVYMLNLAPLPNVSVKLSGLVTLDALPAWNVQRIRLFVEAVARLFGYSRMMFGSDWPAHKDAATYRQTLEAALEAAGPMTDAQAGLVLSGAAAEFYRLG